MKRLTSILGGFKAFFIRLVTKRFYSVQDLKRKANLYNRKKRRKYIITIIRGLEKGVVRDAKAGKYFSELKTTEERHSKHYDNMVAFRWLLRYSRYKPKVIDEKIVTLNGTRYIEMIAIRFDWGSSS